jgi:hypothetical protein
MQVRSDTRADLKYYKANDHHQDVRPPVTEPPDGSWLGSGLAVTDSRHSRHAITFLLHYPPLHMRVGTKPKVQLVPKLSPLVPEITERQILWGIRGTYPGPERCSLVSVFVNEFVSR